MSDVYLALGSNLAPRRHLSCALARLRARYPLLRMSGWFLTIPWGCQPQPWFLNCAAQVTTTDTPDDVLAFTQRLERLAGRRRVMANGPRTLDIDLLLYDDRVLEGDRLTLPHPGLRERDFMLLPLLELAPHARDPRDGSPLSCALTAVAYRQIVRRVAAAPAGHPARCGAASAYTGTGGSR